MDKRDRKEIISKINFIFDNSCFECPNNFSSSSNTTNKACLECPALKELQVLGKLLINDEKKIKPQLRIPNIEFDRLFETGLYMQKEIAEILNVSTKTVTTHKQRWEKERRENKCQLKNLVHVRN